MIGVSCSLVQTNGIEGESGIFLGNVSICWLLHILVTCKVHFRGGSVKTVSCAATMG